jgi:hypothetical protein
LFQIDRDAKEMFSKLIERMAIQDEKGRKTLQTQYYYDKIKQKRLKCRNNGG